MLGDRRSRHPEWSRQFAGIDILVSHRIQDLPPNRIGKGLEDAVQLLFAKFNLLVNFILAAPVCLAERPCKVMTDT